MTGNLTVPSLNGGPLAGFRNVLINGDLRINQRGVTIAAAAVGQYGPDRWKKVDASNMTQIVEDVNYVHGATYTLSGTGVTTQQLTAPASGHWTLPKIPITATNIQLEVGPVKTPFEKRPIGVELFLCERYCQDAGATATGYEESATTMGFEVKLATPMRAAPTVKLKLPTISTRVITATGGIDRGVAVTIDPASSTQERGAWIYLQGIGGVAARPIMNRNNASWFRFEAELF
jgi:hypothetical protein